MDNDQCETLRYEVRVAKSMDHPNIVTIYETYQDKKKYYIVFEFLIELSCLMQSPAGTVFPKAMLQI